MIIVFERYTEFVEKWKETAQGMGIESKILVIEDEGFLPDGILSPYEYFTYRDDFGMFSQKKIFFDFLEIPEYWEMHAEDISSAAIYDMGSRKGRVYYSEPLEQRNVRRVEWEMENGWVYRADLYNKYGLKYASEFRDVFGNVQSKVFYSSSGQERIVVYPQNDTVVVTENGETKYYFVSKMQFVDFYLEKRWPGEKRVLFVQDESQIPSIEVKTGRNPVWELVLFRNDRLLKKYADMGGEHGQRFYAVPKVYPMNRARGAALILTASDQIAGIGYLTDILSDVQFHIAANTQISDRLLGLGKKENVQVWPQIEPQDLNNLWEKCDFYLDINYYREIYDAVDCHDHPPNIP